MLPDPDALIFDFDGTLVASGDLHFSAMAAAALRQGAEMARTWYDARTGLGRRDLMTQFSEHAHLALDVESLVQDSIAAAELRASMARINPPVVALARRYAGMRPMAVATNGEARVVDRILEATDLVGLFDAIVTVDQVASPKPAPDIFLEAARRLGVRPHGCLVLEDSNEGLAAARSAGMTALDVRLAETLTQIDKMAPVHD